jgi:catechol 2,3-dioxygenase-like lactoylglutathione lyase family enzyme
MKNIIVLPRVVAALLCLLIFSAKAQTKHTTMKLNAGFITPKLEETKIFYTTVLQMEVVFENDFYLLLRTAGGTDQISFLLPNHESQQPLFKPAFVGKGAYLTIEVEKVDEMYEKMMKMNIPIAIAMRDEPWGDRHFAITDPNGIGIDIVTYNPQTK